MDRERAQEWLDRYVQAWRSYDPEQIGQLFSEDVEYRYHPYDEPVVGRDAVVRGWTAPEGNESERDEPGTWGAHYEPWAVDGSRVTAVGWSRYYTDASQATVDKTYDNAFLIEFDDAGRCRSFTEFFMKRPDGR